MTTELSELIHNVRQCSICADKLEHGVRPVIQISSRATILIAGQAPGARVHNSGVPFDDASGNRLREWMNVDRETFYDSHKVAILPMGFCYPGKGKSGDLAPQKICADTWRSPLLNALPNLKLTLVIGQYAMAWHLPNNKIDDKKRSLTETVRAWPTFPKGLLPLPHPSPRNNIWLNKNKWFEEDVLPELKHRVKQALQH